MPPPRYHTTRLFLIARVPKTGTFEEGLELFVLRPECGGDRLGRVSRVERGE